MKTIHRYIVLLVILPLIVFLGSCSKTAENEHLPEYCQTYSGFMATASKDFYDLIGDINRFNYLSVISEIELEFEEDNPNIEIDLDGIQCFQNLTSLTLTGRSFKDISPISALKNIQKIVLVNTSIVSIDSFKNLSKVNELTISNTKTLQSVDGVEEMTKLTRLDLSDNGIVNIDGLNNLVNLTELILINNEITYFPSINQLELLETLDVSNNNIEQLGEDLSGLSNLVEFIARNNNICDLSTLDDLTNLEVLDLSENDLGCGGNGVSPDFSSLLNAPHLKEIYLNDNNLTSIEDLRGKVLPLEVLHLENNNLTDITPIGNYTGIEELVLFNNNISNIDDLSGMINVTEVDLSDNSITDFTDLLGINNLEFINLSGNNITFIPVMADSWPNLRLLDLEGNNLIDTSGVEGHANIRELILNNNGLAELAGISDLPLLESLVIFQEIPEEIPEDFEFEDNPNDISVIIDSFNSVPGLVLIDATFTFDFGFELGSNISIFNSISDIDDVINIDFSGMDIDFIDGESINLKDLRSIDISNNNITDITFILGNTRLQNLNISNNDIANLSVISGNETESSDLDNLDQVDASNISASNELVDAFIYLPDLSYIDLTGSNIVGITNCFNGLNELTTLAIDSPVLERIVDSFNDLFAVHTVENIISFSNSAVGEISGSFNTGLYEQIVFQDNDASFSETLIVDSFNDLEVAHSNSIVITGNDFKQMSGSFNNLTVVNLILGENNIEIIADSLSNINADNLFLADNNIESITTSLGNLNVLVELNLQNNKIPTIVGLNSAIFIPSIDLSNNALITVSFLDGITGVEYLDISSQFDYDLGVLTLTDIDGINNMPLLTDLVMNSIVMTSIDGFKNIDIDTFTLNKSDNGDIPITSISPESFSNSAITELDLGGHEISNAEFLSNFDSLTDLTISVDIADLSDFQVASLEMTVESLSLENIQEVTDFSYLSGYDILTFFDFSSEATFEINNFDGMALLSNSNFAQRTDITSISGSFNTMDSLTLTGTYTDIFTSLTDISTSFNMYEITDTITIGGDINITESFVNVGNLNLNSGAETVINFDPLSFTNIRMLFIEESNHISHSFLNGYEYLHYVEINTLSKNILDLENNNIEDLYLYGISHFVTIMDIDVSSTAQIIFESSSALNSAISLDSSNLTFDSPLSTVVLSIDRVDVELMGTLHVLTVNSANLEHANLGDLEATDMTFNTDSLNQISRESTVLNADTLEVNSLSPTMDIDVRVTTLDIHDNLATEYNINVTGGVANIYGNEADVVIDFDGSHLFVMYDSLETMDISGDFDDFTVDSNSLIDVNLNDITINLADIASEAAIVNVEGSSISTLELNDDNLTDITLNVPAAHITLTSFSSSAMDIDVTADILEMGTVNIPEITLTTTSDLAAIDLTEGSSISSLVFNDATVIDTSLETDETDLTISGTNITNISISAANLTDIDMNTPGALLDIDTSTTAIIGELALSIVSFESTNLTNLTLNPASSIGTVNLFNSSSLDTLDLTTASIDNLNVNSNAVTMDISAVNVLETALNGDSFINVIADLGANNLTFTSGKISDMTFDIIGTDVSIDTTLNTVFFNNTSEIVNLSLASVNLNRVDGGSGLFTTMDIIESVETLSVTGSNITALNVDSNIMQTFDVDVALATDVTLTNTYTGNCTITTTTEDISITSGGNVDLTSSTLSSATLEISSNSASFDLTKPSLDFTLYGTMGDIVVFGFTMNNFIVGAGLSIGKLELANDNITSLDFSLGTVTDLKITSTNTTMDILGNDLTGALLLMTNLDDLTVINSTIGATVTVDTTATTFSLDGSFDNIDFVGNNVTSIDLNGTINIADIEGSSITSVDLIDADYTELVLNADILASLDTLTSVSGSLNLTSSIDDFNLTSNIPYINFVGGINDNLNIITTAVDMELNTRNDSINLDGATTDFTITGLNLNGIDGSAGAIYVNGTTGLNLFTFDVDADSVIFDSDSPSQIQFNGVRTIPTIDIISQSIQLIDTQDVVVTTLNSDSGGTNCAVDTKATNINHTNTTGDVIVFIVYEDTQLFNTNSEIVDLQSVGGNSISFEYNGTNALDLSLSNILDFTIDVTTGSEVNFNDIPNNIILDGTNVNAVSLTSGSAEAASLTFNGINDLDVTLDNIGVLTIDITTGTTVNFDGIPSDIILSGSNVNTVAIVSSSVEDASLTFNGTNALEITPSNIGVLTLDITTADAVNFNEVPTDIILNGVNVDTVSLASSSSESTRLTYSLAGALDLSIDNIGVLILEMTTTDTVNFTGVPTDITLDGANINTVSLASASSESTTLTYSEAGALDLSIDNIGVLTLDITTSDTVNFSGLPTEIILSGVNVDTVSLLSTSTESTTLTYNEANVLDLSIDNIGVLTLDITTGDTVNFNEVPTDLILSGVNVDTVSLLSTTTEPTTLTYNEANILDVSIDNIGELTLDLVIGTTVNLSGIPTDLIISGVNVDTVSLLSASTEAASLTFNGTNALDITLDNIGVFTIDVTTGNTVNFDGIPTDIILDGTNVNTVSLLSGSTEAASLTFNGANALDITLENIGVFTMDVTTGSEINFDGDATNIVLSGANISTVTTDTLTLTTRYTMNGTLITDLEFVSAGLLASISEIEVDSLVSGNTGTIITKLQGTAITLYSDITEQDIYDYYYDEEYTSLTDQEAIDSVRYDAIKDPLIADALAKIRENTNFDYTLDAELTEDIDTQVYETTQYYFDAYALGEGTTEAQMVIDFGQLYVDNIKTTITVTLAEPELVIVEATIEASVESGIEDDSNTQATIDSGNITFTIG